MQAGDPPTTVLKGAPNFRDLGGLPVGDGRRVRHGLIYRSESFITLTEDDVNRLVAVDLRVVCDLRSAAERARHGGELPGPELLPLVDSTGSDPEQDGLRSIDDPSSVIRYNTASYREYPRSLAPTMRQLFGRIIDGRVPVVISCNAGKDRTGVVCAILELALGADRDTVVADYLRSNDFYGAPRIGPILRQRGGRDPHPDAITAFCCQREYLEEAFQTIEERGGLDRYLDHDVDLTVDKRERLRGILTESV